MPSPTRNGDRRSGIVRPSERPVQSTRTGAGRGRGRLAPIFIEPRNAYPMVLTATMNCRAVNTAESCKCGRDPALSASSRPENRCGPGQDHDLVLLQRHVPLVAQILVALQGSDQPPAVLPEEQTAGLLAGVAHRREDLCPAVQRDRLGVVGTDVRDQDDPVRRCALVQEALCRRNDGRGLAGGRQQDGQRSRSAMGVGHVRSPPTRCLPGAIAGEVCRRVISVMPEVRAGDSVRDTTPVADHSARTAASTPAIDLRPLRSTSHRPCNRSSRVTCRSMSVTRSLLR